METSVKQRIIQFIKYKGLTIRKFEMLVGLSNAYVNHIKSGIGSDVLMKILSTFPDLSQNWLINGTGPMLKDGIVEKDGKLQIKKAKEPKTDGYNVPLVMAEATAGGLPLIDNPGETINQLQTIQCPVRADLAMAVTGHSMEPQYPDGSIVLLKSVNPDIFIEWGCVYVLDTENGAVLKEIQKSDDDSKVKCVSLNADGKYQPYDVPKTAIRKWFRVVYLMCAK